MKKLPFTKEQIESLLERHKSPLYIYDELGIRNFAKGLKNAFNWVGKGGYKNYFAVKACPNPHILKILKEEGMGADCSSMAELILAERIGLRGEEIMFTSNDTPLEEFQKARDLGAIINFDDISHLDFYLENIGQLPELICFRYNPGDLKDGNEIIGNPIEAKYGLTKEQLFQAYEKASKNGARRFALHSMVVSNMLDINYHADTLKMLLELSREIKEKLGIELEFLNIGGGLGIPYKPEEKAVDLKELSAALENEYKNHLQKGGSAVRIVSEYGRAVTGPYGFLITKVLHRMKKYKNYIGVDASMSNLMRPALYGAYHHITILGKEDLPATHKYDVVGSLCENNDKFAIDRLLPETEPGDILILHDAGAHGYAMGFQYNGKLRSAEFLLTQDGSFRQIRRAETLDDYFATLDWGQFNS